MKRQQRRRAKRDRQFLNPVWIEKEGRESAAESVIWREVAGGRRSSLAPCGRGRSHRSKTREGASGRDGRAAVTGVWKLPERWTRRARAHRPWKTTEQFSTSSHTHPRGHFYRVKNGDISNEL